MEFRILGDVQVAYSDQLLALGTPKQRLLLSVLLCQPGQVVPVDRLVEALWAGQAPASAASNVRLYVHQLRRVLGAERVVGRGRGYALAVVPAQVDSHQFTELARDGRSALTAGAVAQARPQLHDALAKWRGRPFADLDDPPALREETARLEELRLSTLEHRIEADLRLGGHTAVVAELTTLVAAHPFREGFHAQLMRALNLCGRRAEALNAYRNARHIFVRELGLEPGPELRQLEKAILTGGHDIHPPLGALIADVASSAQRPSQSAKGTRAPTSGQTSAAPAKRGESLEHLDTPPPTPASPATTPYPVPAQLPRDVHGFTGRTSELAHLDTILATADKRSAALVITALSGTAGVGKTALAVHWAHRITDQFPGGQLYVNLRGFDPAGTPMSPGEAVRGFLDAFAVPPERVPDNLDAQVGLYRSLLAGKRMLILLDNARDAEQVRPILPGAPGCLVVVTSRNQLTGLVAAEGAHPVVLDLLTHDEARDLLTRRLGPARVASEPQAVDQIIGACALLPLALAIVAARAATRPTFPLALLASELCEARSLDALVGEDAKTDVREIFSWSYQALSSPAARLFRLLGLHPGPEFSAAAAASLAGAPLPHVRPLLAELTRTHMIIERVPGRYAFHDLLRNYAIELTEDTDPEAERRSVLHRLHDHYLHTANNGARLMGSSLVAGLPQIQPGVTPEQFPDARHAMAWFITEHQVLVAACRHAAATGFEEHAWRLPCHLRVPFYRRGHWHDWLSIQQAALEAAQRSTDRSGQAHSHHDLARVLSLLGRLDDALMHLRHALDLFTQLGDRDGQASALTGFGHLAMLQRQFPEALRYHLRALAIARQARSRIGEANSLNNAAWNYAHLSDYDRALAFANQALTVLAGVDSYRWTMASTWDTMAYIQHRLGHHAQAVTSYERSAELFRESGARYQEARTLERLGDLHQETGDHAAARRAWLDALKLYDDLGHPDADRVRAKLQPGPGPFNPRIGTTFSR